MKTAKELRVSLEKINHKSYPYYKDLKGSYKFKNFILEINHVQSDPYASPSDLTVRILRPGFPSVYYEKYEQRIALQDQILRLFHEGLKEYASNGRSKKSGSLSVSRPNQKVLERSACTIKPDTGELILKFHAAFPAAGRKILSHELIRILFNELEPLVDHYLIYDHLSKENQECLQRAFELSVDQCAIRHQLKEKHLSAFIADGAILPRKSGNLDIPMAEAIPFQSPESLMVEMDLPYRKKIRGMGIPEGIVLITGGGYHGKSTLLQALEEGVYNHVDGDGRELAITRSDAMKIRAEDGRSVKADDISMFIQNLPTKKDTRCFMTEDASGSTSQAANVVEAIEAGSKLLLVDEDTSATNFMVRDDLMASVISKDEEPIIPFIARIRPLKEEKGVSVILVAGSSGAFFDKADTVIQMDEYVPKDITQKAKEAIKNHTQSSVIDDVPFNQEIRSRIPLKNRVLDQDRIKVKTTGLDTISIGREPIDVRYLEQLVDPEQLKTLGKMAVYAGKNLMDSKSSLDMVAGEMCDLIKRDGWQILGKGDYAQVRKQDLMNVLSRWRTQPFIQLED
ncbi:ABC-ATPase domain-containing protein [Ileibacterium valens]|uniref:Isopentenyl-diphosphate delta-isomerase n=1 Tax=Ileibacterium valens TaxID=1862668 RepID=A0A1U7NG06_9FIRM|nr:ABC-ATPase domain-containing protein [Ileibacterium valens]OLU39413.1 hypothetical protein BM735_07430 [Erysipelotrichaceae bacterium NYU-BL-F16]OLU39614.1 hypothetical protein BO222_06350 [Ileibacterium valens]OLU40511.1 hypothetical protein BO224_05365 [Erysipelotrichaceae bacterium NYU-BL-E8]